MLMRADDTRGRRSSGWDFARRFDGARRLLRRLSGGGDADARSLDRYVIQPPSMQNAIDAIPGWVGAMPPETGLRAGEAFLFADTRIAWLTRQRYDIAGKSVLELGPLEGFHTHMLHEAGAASIDAIEANALAYMRCLVTKETLGLTRARFLLGDFMPWLETNETTYDLVVASGVLYHSQDPVRLLDLIARRANAIFLWTHYFDEAAMPPGDVRRGPFSGKVLTRTCRGVTLRVHERRYLKAWRDPKFCGGTHDRHYWLERDGILRLLEAAGFSTFVFADEQPQHGGGPSFSLFATRDVPQAEAVPEEAAPNEAVSNEAISNEASSDPTPDAPG